MAAHFAAALLWWGMLIDIVLFFVLAVVVMVMAVQRIWRLRLGKMLWRRDGQYSGLGGWIGTLDKPYNGY